MFQCPKGQIYSFVIIALKEVVAAISIPILALRIKMIWVDYTHVVNICLMIVGSIRRINRMAYCDFCDCEDCQNGTSYLFHAQTSDGRWICDVCYSYDECINQQRKISGTHNGPCENRNCEHRPSIVSEWI